MLKKDFESLRNMTVSEIMKYRPKINNNPSSLDLYELKLGINIAIFSGFDQKENSNIVDLFWLTDALDNVFGYINDLTTNIEKNDINFKTVWDLYGNILNAKEKLESLDKKKYTKFIKGLESIDNMIYGNDKIGFSTDKIDSDVLKNITSVCEEIKENITDEINNIINDTENYKEELKKYPDDILDIYKEIMNLHLANLRADSYDEVQNNTDGFEKWAKDNYSESEYYPQIKRMIAACVENMINRQYVIKSKRSK